MQPHTAAVAAADAGITNPGPSHSVPPSFSQVATLGGVLTGIHLGEVPRDVAAAGGSSAAQESAQM